MLRKNIDRYTTNMIFVTIEVCNEYYEVTVLNHFKGLDSSPKTGHLQEFITKKCAVPLVVITVTESLRLRAQH